MKKCLICDRIAKIKAHTNPYFVTELQTGYVVLGDHQFFKGYSLFLCKIHAVELHDLEPGFRFEFLKEMSLVAEAVHKAFQPKKLNYELLGNVENHLHWHIFPRYGNDPSPKNPTWCIDGSITRAESERPSPEQLQCFKQKLLTRIELTKRSLAPLGLVLRQRKAGRP